MACSRWNTCRRTVTLKSQFRLAISSRLFADTGICQIYNETVTMSKALCLRISSQDKTFKVRRENLSKKVPFLKNFKLRECFPNSVYLAKGKLLNKFNPEMDLLSNAPSAYEYNDSVNLIGFRRMGTASPDPSNSAKTEFDPHAIFRSSNYYMRICGGYIQ